MSETPSFMIRFEGQHVNGSQTLLTFEGNIFYTTIPLIRGKTSRKRLVLVRCEVLGQFLNKMTADYNYFHWDLENLPQRVQTHISLKPKTFSGFFIAFPKSTFNFEYFEAKNVTPIAELLTKLINEKQVAT